MEPPISLAADAVRDEKVKVLRSLRRWSARGAGERRARPVRARLRRRATRSPLSRGAGRREGLAARDVRRDAASTSTTGAGRRAVLRPRRQAPRAARDEIAIQFKKVPHGLFRAPDDGLSPNVLTLRIQPDEGISLRFTRRSPGRAPSSATCAMDFRYGGALSAEHARGVRAAAPRLPCAATRRSSPAPTRSRSSGRYVDTMFDAWRAAARFPLYAAGTWGPEPPTSFCTATAARGVATEARDR